MSWSVRARSQSVRIQPIRSSAACRCSTTPGGSGDRPEHLADDPQARLGLPATDHLGAHQPGEPVQPEPTGAGQVPVVAGHDHGQRGDPGRRLERLRGRLQRCGPYALEQVADLLHAPGVRLQQLLPPGAQVPQPPPRRVDRLRQVAAQLSGQPGDQDRVLVVGLIDWSGPRSCGRTPTPPAARTRTTCPGPRRAGPAPATGARSAHTPPSPRRTPPEQPGQPAQSNAATEVPGLAPERAPRQHPRVVVAHHHHLLTVGQVDPHDRVDHRHRLPQPASRAFRFRSPRDTPLPLDMNVLLDAMGHQARQAHQEDVPHARPERFNAFLCRRSQGVGATLPRSEEVRCGAWGFRKVDA